MIPFLFLFDRDALGKFPDFPDEDDGGSENIFKQKDPAELERELKEQVIVVFILFHTLLLRELFIFYLFQFQLCILKF